jgi:hypothetical protein
MLYTKSVSPAYFDGLDPGLNAHHSKKLRHFRQSFATQFLINNFTSPALPIQFLGPAANGM